MGIALHFNDVNSAPCNIAQQNCKIAVDRLNAPPYMPLHRRGADAEMLISPALVAKKDGHNDLGFTEVFCVLFGLSVL
ncbi:MAG: hypothetical protein KGJ57_19655 [Sphingomonadales bacterium]|nr:hypothetical protein [Sphingomonadales bacterium]MDE2171611.1 hypothetical protein [Sphingomonadales bacterium]